MDIQKKLAEELNIRLSQAESVVRLIDEGNTIPFIARYRKEATGSLNDEVLRNLYERLQYLRNLEDKKEQVIQAIDSQGKLTEELRKQISDAETLVSVEDLYRPYKQKKRTRAMIAREKGLEPLAEKILLQEVTDLKKEAVNYLSDAEGLEVKTVEEALQGAADIIAEQIADEAEYRSAIRRFTMKNGLVTSEVKDEKADENGTYEVYYHFSDSPEKCPGHRILAMNRGENEKILSVKIETQEEQILSAMERMIIKKDDPETKQFLKSTIRDSFRRLIYPSVEREIRSEMTERAEEGAIRVFGSNLSQLLMQPPIAGKRVLGWDPAFRTGCKLAVVDETGKVLDTTVIFPTAPQNKVEESKRILKNLIRKYDVSLISVGNGTASRESEQVIAELIRELQKENRSVQYVIVSEAGASVYSASKLATEEFPEFDVGQRSAASIARRLQDPLSELVKIDPQAIGVGQYQHDCDQKKLSEALSGVVEDCVNRVGVDLNTASASLLQYVSGISKAVASNIVAYREENGRFRSRQELLKVQKLGPKAFQQCAGFLRIRGGKEPLDATSVHPESYEAAKKLIRKAGLDEKTLGPEGFREIRKAVPDTGKAAEELGIGKITLQDILTELEKPGRDPREDLPKPVLKSDVLSMEDLYEGMILKGTVRNVIDFGAFVDIGVHQDGLVHVSQISKDFIRHPLEKVSIGDVVEVKVLSVDLKKKRISLTMKL